MKIIIEGTSQEIEEAKSFLDKECLFDDLGCDNFESCEECERKRNIFKEFHIVD